MTKPEFLDALRAELAGLPDEDISKSLEYYSEIIDDCMEDGQTEEDAVAALGAPDAVARQILMDTSLPRLVRARVKPRRTLEVWEIILIIVGAPVWLPLLLSAVVVLLTLYFVFWVMIAVLYIVDLSFVVCTLAGLIGGFAAVFNGQPAQAALFLGAGILLFGVAVLLFPVFNKIAAALVGVSRRFVLWIKSLFIGKGTVK